MRRRYRHVLARGEHFADLPVTDLHALRLQTKRLRYLGEFCEPLFAGKSAARFLRRLSRLQEKLGALNDGAVAQQLLQSLPKATRRAQGIVLGYVAGRTEDKRDVLAKTWKRFRKQDAFW
jgi:CHAD domain-containing protein